MVLSNMYESMMVIQLIMLIAAVGCVPTSVLVKNSELMNHKVKRSSMKNSSNNINFYDHLNFKDNKSIVKSPSTQSSANVEAINNEAEQLDGETKLQSDKQQHEDNESPATMQKRGVNQQLLYDLGRGSSRYHNDMYNSPLLSSGPIPNGAWADEIDPALVYSDLSDFDEYSRVPSQYRNKAYDNLQNILNSETYLEPVTLPLQFPNRYYVSDRKKRSNRNKINKYDMRLKRESKMTPADMLALVALVEAGERTRDEEENDLNSYSVPEQFTNSKGIYAEYGHPSDIYHDYNDNAMKLWLSQPSVAQYYGIPPYNIEQLPKYEVVREHNNGPNRFPNKRIMMSKRKRSSERSYNDPNQHFSNMSIKIPSVQKYY